MIEQSEHLTVLKKTPRKRSLDYDTLSGRSAHSLVAKAEELYMYGGEGRCKSVLKMVHLITDTVTKFDISFCGIFAGLTFADMFVLHKFPKIPGYSTKLYFQYSVLRMISILLFFLLYTWICVVFGRIRSKEPTLSQKICH